jgi:ribosome biogenesis protein NSA2
MFGHKAKLHHAKRHSEKIQMKKQLKAHDERNVKQKDDGAVQEGALPTYLLDREGQKVGQPIISELTAGRKSIIVRYQRQEKGSSRQVRCTSTQGSRNRRRG